MKNLYVKTLISYVGTIPTILLIYRVYFLISFVDLYRNINKKYICFKGLKMGEYLTEVSTLPAKRKKHM